MFKSNITECKRQRSYRRVARNTGEKYYSAHKFWKALERSPLSARHRSCRCAGDRIQMATRRTAIMDRAVCKLQKCADNGQCGVDF